MDNDVEKMKAEAERIRRYGGEMEGMSCGIESGLGLLEDAICDAGGEGRCLWLIQKLTQDYERMKILIQAVSNPHSSGCIAKADNLLQAA